MDLTCPHCRHTVEVAEGESKKCPNCGQVVRQNKPQPAVPQVPHAIPAPTQPNLAAIAATMPKPTDSVAMTSFICSLLFFVPFVTQAVAIIAGLIAILSSRRKEKRVGLAWVGLILGICIAFFWMAVISTVSSQVRMAGWAVPAQNEPDLDAAERDSALFQEMEVIQKAVVAYHSDFRKWPDNIGQLRGPYLAPSYKTPDKLTWNAIPKNTKTTQDWPLLISGEVRHDKEGAELHLPKRIVLRLSGRFDLLTPDETSELLKKYSADSPQPAQPTTSPPATTDSPSNSNSNGSD